MQPRVIYLLVKTMLQKRIFKKMLVFRRKGTVANIRGLFL